MEEGFNRPVLELFDYPYEELVRDIKIGREIEFSYKGIIYGTLNVKEGFV